MKNIYPIGGFAPGNYSCTCVTCKKEFIGDKRVVQCESCAIEMVQTLVEVNKQGGVEIIKTKSLQDEINHWYKKTGSLTTEQIVKSAYSVGLQESQINNRDIKELICLLQSTTEYEVLESFKNKVDKFKIKYNDN